MASPMSSPSPRKESLEVPTLRQTPNQSSRAQSVISLDGFRPPSPLPASPGGGITGDQDMVYDLAESIQIDGAKVAS